MFTHFKKIAQSHNIYEQQEQQILSEVPYNAVKHFLFTLPDILSFLLTFIVIITIGEIFVTTIASVFAQALVDLHTQFELVERE